MQPVHEALGAQRYAQLQGLLASPAQRARHVLQVTAAAWWPDGEIPVSRKAATRLARVHAHGHGAAHARHRHHHA